MKPGTVLRIIDKDDLEPRKVLDHGVVQLIDCMGSDQSIVDDARVSIAGEEVKAISDNRGLIRYLLRMWHTTPFEGVVMKFYIKMPIFVARQMVRHRMATINEMSARYGVLPEEFYVPELEQICWQSTDNKQGRSGEVPASVAMIVQRAMRMEAASAFEQYHGYLGQNEPSGGPESDIEAALKDGGGLARELARINLPLSTYTVWRWKIDLHNLMHFLRLRLDSHAQWEIRVYAEAMASIVKGLVPMAWEAFEDFRLNAVTFSRHDLIALRYLLTGCPDEQQAMDAIEWPTKRERAEFEAKLNKLLGR